MSVLDALPDGVTGIDTHMGGASEITAGFLLAGERPALIETGPAKVAGAIAAGWPTPGSTRETWPGSWSPTSTSTTPAGSATWSGPSRTPPWSSTRPAPGTWSTPNGCWPARPGSTGR